LRVSWDKAIDRFRGRTGFAALLLLTVSSFLVRFLFLSSNPHPFGFDGYYYVTQLTRFVISGHLHSPESSWVLWLMVPLRFVLGDSILAVKLAGAVLAALCVPAAFWAVSAFGSKRAEGYSKDDFHIAPWLAAVWAAGSPVLSLMAAEFPKNLGMITTGLCFWALWWSKPNGKLHWLGLAIFALLTFTAHRLGILLLLIVIVGTLIERWMQPGILQAKKTKAWLLPALFAGIAVSFACLSYFLPNLLHPSDLERLKGALGTRPAWLPFAYFGLWSPSWALRIEIGAGWPLLLLMGSAFFRTKEMRPWLIVFAATFLLCNFPFWNSHRLDLGFRLGLLGPLSTLFPVILLLWFRRPKAVSRRHSVVVAGAALCCLGWFCLSPLGVQTVRMPPYDRYRAMVARIPKPYPKKVIAHSGMNFYYGHLTRHPAVAWAPRPSEKRKEIFRIAWGIDDGEWLAFLKDHDAKATPRRLDPDYTYLREDDWEEFVRRAEESGDKDLLERIYSSKNPHRPKPEYLLRNWNNEFRKTDR